MKSISVSEDIDVAPPPSLLAYSISYLLIGLLVAAFTKSIFKRDAKVALMMGAIAVVLHHTFDAPLARKLMTWNLIPESRRATQRSSQSGPEKR
jgi:hypothetical protein